MLRAAATNRPFASDRPIEMEVSDGGPNGHVSLDGTYMFEGEC